MTLPDLIKALEAATGPSECHIWPRKKDATGRGRIWVDGKIKLAHRAVWEMKNGPIPVGMLLCHHCDNPSCVNIAHLYVGTSADNSRDMVDRDRHFSVRHPEAAAEMGRKLGLQNTWARGTGNPKAKLSPEQVATIKVDGRPTRFLVADYGVTRTTIQRIRSGDLWPVSPR